MIAFLFDLPGWLLLLFGGGLAELGHTALHHRGELAAVLLAVFGWFVRQRRLFVSTGARVMSAEAKAAAKAAAKARADASGRHETREALAA